MFWQKIELEEMKELLKGIGEDNKVYKLIQSEKKDFTDQDYEKYNLIRKIGIKKSYTPRFFCMYDILKMKDGIKLKIRIDMQLYHNNLQNKTVITQSKKRKWYHTEKEIKFSKLSVK